MKQSVWILNSSLLILFLISQLLLFMLQKSVPRRVSLNTNAGVVIEEPVIEPVNIATIYENDLFGTYEMPIVTPVKIDDSIVSMPKPPKNIASQVPVEKAPTFFAPLEGVLKGIIFVKDDPSSSLAIIQFKKTKEEQNYQVGDLIEDAQILKILPNRIIIIRSNGQQETLYLREEDAINDFDAQSTLVPKNIIESSSGNKYKINIDAFIKRVSNLGEFINVLDLTTAYRQGKSFGCRVGKISKDSLGSMLGFMPDDIIIKIDGYSVDNLTNRLKIYEHVLSSVTGDIIEVVVLRGDATITMLYGLVDDASKNMIFSKQDIHKQLVEKLRVSDENNDNVVIQSQESFTISDEEPVDENQLHEEISETENTSFMIPEYTVSSPMVMPVNHHEKLHEIDAHKKRLIQEREKLMPTVQDLKAQDRKNMLKQTNRNVIFNGMTQ